MRKVILVGLLTLLVVSGSVFCISWFVQSGELKSHVERSIAKLNEKQTYVTYDSIEVSGFPTHIALSIVNPHFSGRVDELLKNLHPEQDISPAQPLPEWHEDIALTGALTFTLNALSDHYTLGASGTWQKSASLAGAATQNIGNNTATESLCSMTLARSSLFSNFWNYKIASENIGEFLKEVREFDCNWPAYNISDLQSGEVLINSGPSRIYFSSVPSGNEQTIRLFVKSTDAEITAAGEKAINTYLMALSPDYPFPTLLSVYGKQNLDMDFSYKGPLEFGSDSARNFNIDLGVFNITNDIYTSKGYFHLMNQESTEQRKSSIDMRFESVYTQLYDMVLKDTVRNFIHHAITSNDPELQHIRAALQPRTPEEAFAVVEPVIPSLQAFGDQVIALNASYEGSSNLMNGDYNLTELAITTTPYGITGSGTAKVAGSPFPQGNVSLVCTNCMQLIDDTLTYTGRVIGVMQTFSAEPPPFTVTPGLIDGTKRFFHNLSGSTPEDKKKGYYTYAIVSDPAGGLTISGRSMGDIIAMYNEYIRQPLEKPSGGVPPAGWSVQ